MKKKNRSKDSKPVLSDNPEHNHSGFVFELLIYVILQLACYYIELGSAFFIIALLYAMFRNTGKRRDGSKSAYSVFNKDASRIGGSLTSDQIEGELLRKMY